MHLSYSDFQCFVPIPNFGFLGFCLAEVDVANSLPFQSVSKESGRFLRADVESLSLTEQESGAAPELKPSQTVYLDFTRV